MIVTRKVGAKWNAGQDAGLAVSPRQYQRLYRVCRTASLPGSGASNLARTTGAISLVNRNGPLSV